MTIPSDDILIRLLNIAADLIHRIDAVNEFVPKKEPSEEEFRKTMEDAGCKWDDDGNLLVPIDGTLTFPPLEGSEKAVNDLFGSPSEIHDLVLDCLGVPADNTIEFSDNDPNATWPDGCFCRDYYQEQIDVANKTRRYKQAITRIRKGLKRGICTPIRIFQVRGIIGKKTL